MFNPYLSKEPQQKDSYEQYTDERYCTKKMVKSDMGGLSLIDGIWKNVTAYRFGHYHSIKSLFNRGKKQFHVIKTPAIAQKIEEITDILTRLDEKLGRNQSEDNAKRLAFDCVAYFAASHGYEGKQIASTVKLGAIAPGEEGLSGLSEYYRDLLDFPRLEKEDFEDFLDEAAASLGIAEGELYRDYDKKNVFMRISEAWEYEDGIESADIHDYLASLFAFLLNDPHSPLLKGLSVLFYCDFVQPFKEKGELLSSLLAKMVFVKQFPNLGPYLPIEGFTKHDPEYLDFANSAVEDGDLSYPVYYFLSSLRRRLADMVIQEVERKDEPAPMIMAEAKEQPSPTPPSGVESRSTPAIDNPPPAIKAPIERIEEIPSSEGKLAIVVRKSQLSEKELKEAARYIAMTHPNLRKTQANFYVSHCEIGCYYTIADYKKHAKCAYETARTSMDKLAEEGFYKKLQLKNKYVYTPIKQN